MKWSLDIEDRIALAGTLHSATRTALCGQNQSEPQLVANLVCGLPRAINALTFSGGFTIKSGGVFVHGQPFVRCQNFPKTSPASVEIGDLLLVRTEIKNEEVAERRALLLQAKMLKSLPATPDNANQHHLYANWPPFTYIRSGEILNAQERHITGLDLYHASRYLLITKHACCRPWHAGWCQLLYPGACCSMTASPSHPRLSHYRCFVGEVLDFILGDAGKPFVIPPPPSRTKNWDRVIKDLTTATALRASSYIERASGSNTDARGQGILFALPSGTQLSSYGVTRDIWSNPSLAELTLSCDSPPKDPGEWPEASDDDGGISIIEFVVSDEGRSE